MSGAGFILTINMFVAGLLAAAFMAIAAYDRRRESARWLALGYAIGVANFLLELVIATVGTSTVLVLAAYAALLAAFTAFNVGIARKYAVPPPWTTMAVIFVVSVVGLSDGLAGRILVISLTALSITVSLGASVGSVGLSLGSTDGFAVFFGLEAFPSVASAASTSPALAFLPRDSGAGDASFFCSLKSTNSRMASSAPSP